MCKYMYRNVELNTYTCFPKELAQQKNRDDEVGLLGITVYTAVPVCPQDCRKGETGGTICWEGYTTDF